MPKEPTTFEDLYDLGMNDRTAHNVAAILPNLPDDESLIRLTGYGSGYYGDEDEVAEFKKRHRPIVPGTDWYRVRVDADEDRDHDPKVEPVPHPFRTFTLNYGDFVEVVSLDPAHYDFEDTDQATLSTFGGDSPHFDPYWEDEPDDPDRRKPSLPV